MNVSEKKVPIQTLHLFPVLDRMLIGLLKSLTEEEWNMPTIAKLWTVKDIAAHLLDGNLRGLSASRDRYLTRPSKPVFSQTDLVDYLNELNADWVKAVQRLSPQLLIELLESTGRTYTQHLTTLSSFDKAIFSVAWAGESASENWFHIAREYTEKFLHQQQIREAVNKQGLFTRELFYPFIQIFMYALPYTYRNVNAPEGTIVEIRISGEAGGQWYIVKTGSNWLLTDRQQPVPDATLTIDGETAWKLFSKGISQEEAMPFVRVSGNKDLGLKALEMIAVMA